MSYWSYMLFLLQAHWYYCTDYWWLFCSLLILLYWLLILLYWPLILLCWAIDTIVQTIDTIVLTIDTIVLTIDTIVLTIVTIVCFCSLTGQSQTLKSFLMNADQRYKSSLITYFTIMLLCSLNDIFFFQSFPGHIFKLFSSPTCAATIANG